MKNIIKVTAILFIVLLSQKTFSQKPFGDSLWTLVFSDEFSGSSIDPTKWYSNWPNNQTSSYIYYNWNTNKNDTVSHKNQKPYETWNFANVNVSSGTAKIISKKENYSGKVWDRWVWSDCWGDTSKEWCPIDSFVPYKYTTGLLISKAQFKYGYYEFRIKLPDHSTTNDLKGLGPACFLYGNSSSVNWSEIDFFEFAGKDDWDGMYNKHTSNIHYRHCSPTSFSLSGCNSTYDTSHWQHPYSSPSSLVFSNQFHKIGMHWTPTAINFYLDDVLYKHADSLSPDFLTSPSKLIEMPIITGISHPTTNFATYVDTVNTVFPYNYEIDYIRVWQYKQNCDSTLNICSFNSATYDPAIYKQVNAGSPSAGSGCTPTISSGQNISFIGKNYVLLDEGFSVQSGAEFLGDVKPCINFFENARMVPPNQSPTPAPQIFFQRYNLKREH